MDDRCRILFHTASPRAIRTIPGAETDQTATSAATFTFPLDCGGKAPADGGAVNAYKIERRLRPDGPWLDVGLAIESETTLTGQERSKEWEYRVSAVNKAGEGAPSNTVMAVL